MAKYKNRFIGLALAFSIALSTLLPFFAVYNHTGLPSVASPAKMASLFGEKVLICTGEGFALVKWADLLSGKTPVKQHKEFFCPLCYIAASGIGKILLLTAVAIFLIREIVIEFSFTYLDDARFRQLAFATSRPRAPPLFLL